MSNFGPYLTEAKYKSAVAYEKGIVDKVNGVPIDGIMFDKQLQKVIDHIKSHPNAPSNLAPARHTGSQKASASETWIKFGGKGKQDFITDMVLAGERVSLKVGKSQLFAGDKHESSALLYSVIDDGGFDQGLAEEIGTLLDGFIFGALTKAQSRQYKTVSNAKKELKELMDADAFNIKARKIVQNKFAANTKLHLAVVQEALTGDIKFDGGVASADFLLAIDKSGKKVTYNSLYYQPFVQEVANKANPNITFSSGLTGKKYTTKIRSFYTVFRMVVDKLEESLEYEGEVLTENIFQDILAKLRNFVTKIVEVIKAQLHKGLEYILDFLGIGLNLNMNKEFEF